jgi:hypothetical protein
MNENLDNLFYEEKLEMRKKQYLLIERHPATKAKKTYTMILI